ncbi:MAG TPA: RnfH family protein [Burkholderiales bacterium]|jgi:putative ubiquitin-RnfH superfamily antitoxin RatB of RatAB toxin-antitoxin module|nr:RnfH family protein [Burkholderiales bacterium]
MAAQPADIEVEVVYALSRREQSIRLIVPEGATVREVLEQSGLLPQVRGKVGIFGKVVSPNKAVADGDRIEIYRPLPADPKEARRRRAARRR